MPSDVMMNAELALLCPWASSLSLLRLGQRKTNCVSHIKRWNSVCKSDEEHGLTHLKQQWGLALSVFLGLYVSDRSTAEDMKTLDDLSLQDILFATHISQNGRRDKEKMFRRNTKSWIVAMNE